MDTTIAQAYRANVLVNVIHGNKVIKQKSRLKTMEIMTSYILLKTGEGKEPAL